MKDKNQYKKMHDSNFGHSTLEEYPKIICLEYCKTKIKSGYENNVIDTLKSFSNKDKFKSKNPHTLNKSKGLETFFRIAKMASSNKVMSLDVKSRKDVHRLFYCIDNNKIHKILSLCSKDSH